MNDTEQILARRLSAETAYRRGVEASDASAALASLASAVLLSPDIPAYRLGFASALAQLDGSVCSRPRLSRRLRRAGILSALSTVLTCGGRAAATAEPFGSAWVLGSIPLRTALSKAATFAPHDVDKALSSRPFHQGAASIIFRALLTGVLIREPELLAQLEKIRRNFAQAVISDGRFELSPSAESVLKDISKQVWIQDGFLTEPVDPDFLGSIASTGKTATIVDLTHALFRSYPAAKMVPAASAR